MRNLDKNTQIKTNNEKEIYYDWREGILSNRK